MKEKIVNMFKTLNPMKLYYSDSKEVYDCYNISIHSKFLNDDEAEREVVFYSKSLNDYEKEKYIQIENRYLNSIQELYDKYDFFELKINEKYSNTNFEIDAIDLILLEQSELENFITDGLREINDFIIVIPDLKIILRNDFDLELIVFSNKNNETNLKILFSFFKKNDFYILPP